MSQPITIRTAARAGVPAGLTVIYAAENQAPSGAAASIWATTGLVWGEAAEAGAPRPGAVSTSFRAMSASVRMISPTLSTPFPDRPIIPPGRFTEGGGWTGML